MIEYPSTPVQPDENSQNKLQSEKLKALGQLTAGIVHDLNNIFHGILGYADAIQLTLVNNAPVREHVKQIIEIAGMGKKLVGQVLTFSRKTQALCEPVDIHSVLENVIMLCEHGINKKITIRKQLSADSFCVNGNRSYLESAFLNLMINARDAMPHGGVISVITRIAVCGENSIEQPVSLCSPSYILK
jgi:signal transduction histidine kinase